METSQKSRLGTVYKDLVRTRSSWLSYDTMDLWTEDSNCLQPTLTSAPSQWRCQGRRAQPSAPALCAERRGPAVAEASEDSWPSSGSCWWISQNSSESRADFTDSEWIQVSISHAEAEGRARANSTWVIFKKLVFGSLAGSPSFGKLFPLKHSGGLRTFFSGLGSHAGSLTITGFLSHWF